MGTYLLWLPLGDFASMQRNGASSLALFLAFAAKQLTDRLLLGSMCRFFYAVALPLVLVLIGAGLLIMPAKRSVSWAVRADVGLAWFAALSTLILVPTDIANALQVCNV